MSLFIVTVHFASAQLILPGFFFFFHPFGRCWWAWAGSVFVLTLGLLFSLRLDGLGAATCLLSNSFCICHPLGLSSPGSRAAPPSQLKPP